MSETGTFTSSSFQSMVGQSTGGEPGSAAEAGRYHPPMVTSATRTVSSILGGAPVEGAPGGVLEVANPARLDEPVAEAHLGDAGTFLEACRIARLAQPGWAGVPAPVRGRAIQHLG